MLTWCLVSVICNFNSFHVFIFKLCITIVHTLNVCTFDKYLLIFRVLNITFSPSEMLSGAVCVIYISNSFHSCIFKLCIQRLFIHLICAPLYLCTFDNIFGVLNLDTITSTPPFGCLHCVICNSKSFLPCYLNLVYCFLEN